MSESSCYEKARKRFNEIAHDMPCLACGTRANIELDHIKPVSMKTLQFTRRSHKGLSYFFAVPLCRECHRKKTLAREEDWYEANIVGGLARAYGLALAMSLQAWSEECN